MPFNSPPRTVEIPKLRTSSDGITNIASTTLDNRVIDTLGDRFGRIWSRLHSGTAPVSATNPLPVTIVTGGLAITWDSTTIAGEASRVTGVGTPELFYLFATNLDVAVTHYLYVFDAVALPGNGAISLYPPIELTPGKTGSIDVSSHGEDFTLGIVSALSTSQPTLTVAAGAVGFFKVGFEP